MNKQVSLTIAIALVILTNVLIKCPLTSDSSDLIIEEVEALADNENVSPIEKNPCKKGGPGYSECSIDGFFSFEGMGGNCSVSCVEGWYACCGVSCTCKKNGE